MASLPRQLLSFSLVGTAGFAVDAGVLLGCMAMLGTGPYLGRLVSFLAAASFTWLGNRLLTFRGSADGGAPAGQWARFLAVASAGGAVNYATYAALIAAGEPFRGHPVLAVGAGSLAGLAFNFAGARRLVFRARPRG